MDIPRPSRKKDLQRRRLIFGAIGLLVFAGVVFGLSQLEPAALSVDRNTVSTGVVTRGEMVRQLRAPGTLVPEDNRWIAADQQGLVDAIEVRPGATVRRSTVVLRLRNPELEQLTQEAELELRAAEAEASDLEVRLASSILDQKARLAEVTADYQGAILKAEADRELSSFGLISNIELQRSELDAKQWTERNQIEHERLANLEASVQAQRDAKEASVEQKRAIFALRRSQLAGLDVQAGIDGVLQEVPVEIGQRVSPGDTLARVARPDKLKAELKIAETLARDVALDQSVAIDTRNGIVAGRVAQIAPAVQEGTVTVEVEITEALPRGARPDLSIEGTVEIERLDDVLHIRRPVYAQANSRASLFVVGDDGAARRTAVSLGRASVDTVEIVSGLDAGAEVILSDTSAWDDVDRIRLN
ncbi:MAG: HlyD family efflux transporter periplasmic adaptor subunit [Acidobacteriota bacterium]